MSNNFKEISLSELDAINRKNPQMKTKMQETGKHPAKATGTQSSGGFVSGDELLVALFPNATSRPCSKWLRERTKAGDVPSSKIGNRVFYSVQKVRAVLNGEAPSLSGEQIASMDEAELWVHYGRILEAKGHYAARKFYLDHIEGKA